MKVVKETFRQLLKKVWSLLHKQIFGYLDGAFAINEICPKFLSVLFTGEIRKGVTEMDILKKYS